jgi:hypothetical protein
MAAGQLRPPVRVGAFPDFPETSWRGIFADYREAMAGTTEASPVAHFGALWSTIAATLGRSMHMYIGRETYPNIFLIHHGPSNDKKTTAHGRLSEHLLIRVPEITELGSREGFADEMVRNAPESGPTVALFRFDEVSSILHQGGVLEFLSRCFDCPAQAGFKYRKNPVTIREPTPTILTATTPTLFWSQARVNDFHTGFLNRFLFLTGKKGDFISETPRPDEARLAGVRNRLWELHNAAVECAARGASLTVEFAPEARDAWDHFYRKDFPGVQRSDLLAAATRRIPMYVVKLALAFAAAEDTLPYIKGDQLIAEVGVGAYAEGSIQLLIDSRTASGSDQVELDLEAHFLDWLKRQQNACARYRFAQQTNKKRMSALQFHRVISALERAEQIRIEKRGNVRFITAL